MQRFLCFPLVLAMLALPPAFSATKEPEVPDKEMLKMIDFLREMEMIKQLEMMRELDRAGSLDEQSKNRQPQKPAPIKRLEASK